jgi:oligosaccharide translocation protein RFT1
MFVALISIVLGCIASIAVTALFLTTTNSDELSIPNYNLAIGIVGFAAFLEILSEPGYIIVHKRMDYSVRMKTEGFAVFFKCVTTYIFVTFCNVRMSLVSLLCNLMFYSTNSWHGHTLNYCMQ